MANRVQEGDLREPPVTACGKHVVIVGGGAVPATAARYKVQMASLMRSSSPDSRTSATASRV